MIGASKGAGGLRCATSPITQAPCVSEMRDARHSMARSGSYRGSAVKVFSCLVLFEASSHLSVVLPSPLLSASGPSLIPESEDVFTMCRLALMNANILKILDQQELADVFAHLEHTQGGHGNGCAALWQETARVTIRKGVTLTAAQAAHHLVTFNQANANWLLYHTRLASSGRMTSRNCHPFQAGKLTLAHNGHDRTWASLGNRLGITDSECMTRMWGRLPLPLDALQESDGVFLGFRGAFPFVVKTRAYADLVLAVNRATGALLFVSELPQVYYDRFDDVIEVGRFTWLGVSPLDLNLIPRRWQYEDSFGPSFCHSYDVTSSPNSTRPLSQNPLSVRRSASTKAAQITMEDLRAFLAKQKGSDEFPALPPPSDSQV